LFVITEETGIAAGVRRIEALTGEGAVVHLQEVRHTLRRLLAALNTPAAQAADAVQRLQADNKRLAREASDLKTKVAIGGRAETSAGSEGVTPLPGGTLVARVLPGLDKDALRAAADAYRDRHRPAVVVLASSTDDKVAIVASVAPELTGKVQAGRIVKEIAPLVGGRGGGRPEFAEAGGKDSSRLEEAIAESRRLVEALLKP
jgi:alanyl-tRNA synthetase